MAKHTWAADDVLLEGIVAAGGVQPYAARIGVASSTLRHHLAKRGIYDAARARLEVRAVIGEARDIASQVGRVKTGEEKPSATLRGDTATIVSRPAPKVGDPVDWIRESGLDPDEWEVRDIRLNTWDAMTSDKGTGDNRVVQMFQVRANCTRKVKLSIIFPAADVAQRRKPAPEVDPEKPQFVVFLPDPHCPYNDVELDKRVDEFLHLKQPTRVTGLGDVLDFQSISRHRDNAAWAAGVQENIQAGFEWWSGKRIAAPDAFMDWIEGNHDFRIRGELLTRAERMYGIKPAQIPGAGEEYDALSLRRLLHLDRLNVDFIGPPKDGDNYQHAHLELAPDLCARHGWLTGQGSAKGTIERLGMSAFFGHTHHQRVHHVTKYKGAKPVAEYVGVECGTLARIEGGLGYATNADWQNGFATATVWPDGAFTYDLARYDGRRLVWRDLRI